MLYIQRRLKLRVLQMLQNGLIIFTMEWSFLSMGDLHTTMTNVMNDSPMVNCPYLGSNAPESLRMVFWIHNWSFWSKYLLYGRHAYLVNKC